MIFPFKLIFGTGAGVELIVCFVVAFGMSLSVFALVIASFAKKESCVVTLISKLHKNGIKTFVIYSGMEVILARFISFLRCFDKLNFSVYGPTTQVKRATTATGVSYIIEDPGLGNICDTGGFGPGNFLTISIGFIGIMFGLLNFYFFVWTHSSIRIGKSTLEIRRNYNPEMFALLNFTILRFIRNTSGGYIIDFIIGCIGFCIVLYHVFLTNSYITPGMRRFHGIPFITGFWFFLVYHINGFLDGYGFAFDKPILTFTLLYFCFLVLYSISSPMIKLENLDIENYKKQEADKLLADIEKLAYVYNKCAHSENKKMVKPLMRYISDYQKNQVKNSKLDSLSFAQLSNFQSSITPESYFKNMLKGVLEHILLKYQQGIKKYPHNVDLRVSMCYILNDFALLKNEALTAAVFCKNLDQDLRQSIKLRYLFKYLEEEDMYHERGYEDANNK